MMHEMVGYMPETQAVSDLAELQTLLQTIG